MVRYEILLITGSRLWGSLTPCRRSNFLGQLGPIQRCDPGDWQMVLEGVEDLHQGQPLSTSRTTVGNVTGTARAPTSFFLSSSLTSFSPPPPPHTTATALLACSLLARNQSESASAASSSHYLTPLSLAAEVVVKAGSEGKELFRRPLRLIKSSSPIGLAICRSTAHFSEHRSPFGSELRLSPTSSRCLRFGAIVLSRSHAEVGTSIRRSKTIFFLPPR